MATRTLYYEADGKMFAVIAEILARHGYTSREWKHSADGGGGWTGWHYWIDIEEDPARPVEAEIDAALKAL